MTYSNYNKHNEDGGGLAEGWILMQDPMGIMKIKA